MRKAAWALLLSMLPACEQCSCGTEVESLVAVARCDRADGDVRRRASTSSAWDSLSVGDALFSGDWVQTALSAAARVEFHSGAKLEVAPGSTVVIEDPGLSKRQRVSVKSGRVEGALVANAELTVQGPDGTPLTLRAKDPARYRLEVEDNGGLAVAVTQGELAVASADGSSAQVAAGESRTVRAGRPISEVERLLPAPSLRAPSAPSRVGAPIVVAATPVPGARDYVFEVSRDPDFDTVEERIESKDADWSFQPKAPGTYYVRAAARSETGRSGSPGAPTKLEVLPPPPADDLLAPPDGTVVATDGSEAVVELRWRASDGDRYRALVTKEPSLSGAAVAQVELQGSTTTVRLPIGHYVWGVYRLRPGEPQPLFPAPRTLSVVSARRELKVPKSIRWR